MKKQIALGGGGIILAGLIGGGIALAVIETKKRNKSVSAAKPPVKKGAATTVSPVSVGTPAAVEATSIPTMMTDSQASTWAANYPILMDGTDYHASIAASSALLPLMNLGLTADQVKNYNVAPPNDAARSVVKARQQDLVVPGVTMTDDQAKVYAADLKLYNTKGTSQADLNSAIKGLQPLVGLRGTGYQVSQFGGISPDDALRKAVAADYAALQPTGNALM